MANKFKVNEGTQVVYRDKMYTEGQTIEPKEETKRKPTCGFGIDGSKSYLLGLRSSVEGSGVSVTLGPVRKGGDGPVMTSPPHPDAAGEVVS